MFGERLWGISRYRCTSFSLLPLPLLLRPLLTSSYSLVSSGFIDAAAANASMCPIANGSSSLQLEKFPDVPPSIKITTAEDIPDAGLRNLDHCKQLSRLLF